MGQKIEKLKELIYVQQDKDIIEAYENLVSYGYKLQAVKDKVVEKSVYNGDFNFVTMEIEKNYCEEVLSEFAQELLGILEG